MSKKNESQHFEMWESLGEEKFLVFGLSFLDKYIHSLSIRK